MPCLAHVKLRLACEKRGNVERALYDIQNELKYWEDYTQGGFVAGSEFTLAGELCARTIETSSEYSADVMRCQTGS